MTAAPSARATEQALRNCADEPSAVPGAIQPHGGLLALTEPDRVLSALDPPDADDVRLVGIGLR